MAYVAEVQTIGDPKYYRNAVVFTTKEEARHYGEDLSYRWTAVTDMRVVETDDRPNYAWRNGGLRVLMEES